MEQWLLVPQMGPPRPGLLLRPRTPSLLLSKPEGDGARRRQRISFAVSRRHSLSVHSPDGGTLSNALSRFNNTHWIVAVRHNMAAYWPYSGTKLLLLCYRSHRPTHSL